MVEETITGAGNGLLESDQLWACLTCGRCTEVCPSDVRFLGFIRDVRTLARESGRQGRCSHGATIQTWMRMMADPGLDQNRLDWLNDEAATGRHLRGLRTAKASDTIYFVGCLPHYEVLFSKIGAQAVEIAQSAVKVLNHLGIEPIVLADERCCGHDLLWEGELDTFRRLAALNAERLRATGAQRIVTTCPECARTLKLDYPQHVGDLGMEVVHISHLIAENELGIQDRGARKVTYHDPCRLARHMDIREEPRQVLSALGSEVVEMQHSRARALCCGTSAWTHCGATAKRLQVDRLREAKETGAETLVTSCAKCQIHFKCALDDPRVADELNIEIKDLVTLVAEAIG